MKVIVFLVLRIGSRHGKASRTHLILSDRTRYRHSGGEDSHDKDMT